MGINRKGLLAVLVVASSLALLPAVPAAAHGTGRERMYGAADAYLTQRVQEVSDTNDVLLAMEFKPTVSGVVNGITICLDLTPQEVNSRLPLYGNLWTADGQFLASGGAYEGIGFASPCFYEISMSPVRVNANQRYVVGFWLRGGQYSYVPHGYDHDLSNATVGHLVAPSTANSTVGAGNGLYAYTSGPGLPFPTESWESSDYLVSPVFTPDPH